ncbi:MAG: dipeptidase [bacterium]|nr:dipeptidase [bacterium]
MNYIPFFDGHNDTLTQTLPQKLSQPTLFPLGTPKTHLDLQRALQSHYLGGLFAIFVDSADEEEADSAAYRTASNQLIMPPPLDHSLARQRTEAVMAQVLRAERAPQCPWRIARTYNDLQRNISEEKLSIVLHIEGAEAIDFELNNLELYYQSGLRSLGLVWSRPNIFGNGVPFERPGNPDSGFGLTPAGRRLVKRCNELGIIVDLAHLNEKGFWDAAKVSAAPLVVSHSAAYAMAPSARNLTDQQLQAIAESNGIVGLTLHVADLRPDGRYDPHLGLAYFMEHLSHIAERIGIEHVGLGSDFDGACMPEELPEVGSLPNLLKALQDAEFSGGDIEKFAYKNWLRVIRDTWH